MRKHYPITFKVTAEEKIKLKKMQEESQMSSMSEYVRAKLLNSESQESMIKDALRILRIWEDRK